jgi:hypothetical protein
MVIIGTAVAIAHRLGGCRIGTKSHINDNPGEAA